MRRARAVWGIAGALADYSESSAFFKYKLLPAPAGGWDQAALGALYCRFGYSDDAAPDVYWLAIIIEVAYSDTGTTYSLTATAAAASATPTDADVAVARSMTGLAAAASATSSNTLAILRSMTGASLAASTTPDTATGSGKGT